MSTKKCFKCEKIKDLSMFYGHPRMRDKHFNKCIECSKADVLSHRANNLERIRAYDRKRNQLPQRIAGRNKYPSPEKRIAQHALGNAVRAGRIKKSKVCEDCGMSGSVQGHHDDYSKPLKVIWLCVPCHAKRHRIYQKVE